RRLADEDRTVDPPPRETRYERTQLAERPAAIEARDDADDAERTRWNRLAARRGRGGRLDVHGGRKSRRRRRRSSALGPATGARAIRSRRVRELEHGLRERA